MPETVRVWLLGGFRVSVGSRTVEENRWRLKKAASLVKLLALAPDHKMHREQVMDLLWPDLEAEAATNNLHRTLHSARHALEPQTPAADSRYLRLGDEQIELCPEGSLWVDAEVFEETAATARRARDPAACRAALDLYAGELLPGDRYEAWAEDRREGLRQTYLSLLLEIAGLHKERENYEPAIEALRKVVAEEPAHEAAHAGLVRLYALTGRRDEALKQYERLREDLRRELDREPNVASRRLHEEILANRFSPTHPPGERPTEDAERARQHNLPAARTSFVGRERELVELKRALAMTRLLTLTGAGGCGKTRLALEVAKDLVGAYPGGVWLVELASLSDPALVPNAVAAALGVRERPDLPLTAALVDAIGSRRMLLVLDNCEHLIEACARLVDALLRSCEHLRVLATSREALEVAGEVNWLVPSLTVPDAGRLPATQRLAQYEAVQLFLERARSRLPTFVLTPENARAVVKVCQRLDGIPLAIELATARMTALAVEQIAERLEDSLGLLTTGSRTAAPRHRTLKATLSWSYELLSEPERALFGRLSVFAGGWTLEAAEAIGTEPGARGGIEEDEILDLLGRLVDKSLVAAEASGDGAPRYRMLEPVRQYGWEKLGNAVGTPTVPETEQVRERHARYYLALVEAAEPELVGIEQVAWLERLTTEYGNLRAALSWFLDEEGAEPEERARMGLRLAAALGRFWGHRGPSEGREWLEKGLAKSGAVPASLRAKALNEAGFIAIYHLDPQAIAMLEEALALFKELGDQSGQAISINYLAHTTGVLANLGRITTLREEAEALLEEPLEDRWAAAHLHLTVGMMAIVGEDYEQVVVRIEEALALFREAGDVRTCAQCLTIMGIGAVGRGDAGRAARAFEETLRLLRQLKDKIGTFYSLIGVAGVAVLRGQPARAARLFGAAEALRKAIGHPVQPLKQLNYDYEGFLATTRGALGEAAFETAFSEGQAMSPEQAIEYALSREAPEEESALPTTPSEQTQGSVLQDALTSREREVALLAGRGLSNRQIASELSISEHTVAAHVRKILNKLGLRSRTQIPPPPSSR
ncbi:MAG: LuxR C-terminal-related transcriptional regulator [Actinobacteria bacterium]|nr:LuxR C-terminal-related transcriptional regulator [Actinomycetota bacterium]